MNEFNEIIIDYENYLELPEFLKERLVKLEKKILAKKYNKEELIEFIDKELKVLKELPKKDLYNLIAHPNFLLFIINLGIEISNLEARTDTNKVFLDKVQELYEFCLSTHRNWFDKIFNTLYSFEDEKIWLISFIKFLFLYPRIADYKTGMFTDNREEVLNMVVKIYQDGNTGNETVVELSCEFALETLLNSDLLKKYYFRISHIAYILEHLIRKIPKLFTILKLKIIKLFDFLFFQISPDLYYEEDKYLLWLLSVCCKFDVGFNQLILSKIFSVYDKETKFSNHQLYVIERMITMFTEIDEKIIENYELLYDGATADLESTDDRPHIIFNGLGIINSFWAYFELNSERKRLVQCYLNHEDEDIQELANKILDK